MKGQAYIGIEGETGVTYTDISEYGVTLTRGWREALLKPSSMKSYTTNDSRLEHGIRMMALAKYAKQKERDVQLSVFIEGTSESDYLAKYENFLNIVAYNGIIFLKVPCMNRIFKLVYTDCTKFGDFGLRKANVTLKFTEPNPTDRETFK